MSAAQLSLVSAVWLGGAVLVWLPWLAAVFLRWRWARKAVPVMGGTWQAILRDIPGGKRVAHLLRHPDTAVPCTWGVCKPVILLPEDAETWEPTHRRMVLAHECAHVLQRDAFWQIADRLFLSLQWFNPCAWLLSRALRTAGERAADDIVLAMEKDAPAYAGLLVQCARQWLVPRATGAATAFMARTSTVAGRVEAILHPGTDRRPPGLAWACLGGATGVLLAVVIPLFSPRVTLAEDAPANTTPETTPGPVPGEVVNLLPDLPPPSPALSWIKIPALKATEGTLEDFIRILRGGPEGKVNILRMTDPDNKRLSLEWPDTNLHEGLEIVSRAFGTEYAVGFRREAGTDPDWMVYVGPLQRCVPFTVNSWRAGAAVPGDLLQKPSLLKEAMVNAGIPFVEGTFTAVDAKSRRVVVKQSWDRFKKVHTFLSTGRADGPFPWHPVQLEDRDFLSAHEMAFFYECELHPRFGDEVNPAQLANPWFCMTWKHNEPEVIVNNTRLLLSSPVLRRDGENWFSRVDLVNLLDHALRPRISLPAASIRTVVIDAGHGGRDSGERNGTLKESALTLDVALRLQKRLEAGGWKVVMTRSGDESVPVQARYATANAERDAFFISLHFGHRPSEERGIRTSILKAAVAPEATDIGLSIHRSCIPVAGTDGGVGVAEASLMSRLMLPGLFIEAGNLQNMDDAILASGEEWREKLAAVIVTGFRAATRPDAAR